MAIESKLKELDAEELVKKQQLEEREKFKRWKCPVCAMRKMDVYNFMDDIRCKECGLPLRNDKRTMEVFVDG